MNLYELKEQLYDNITCYLDNVVACEFHDTYLSDDVAYNVCNIIDEVFENAFFAPSPLDKTTSN